MRTEDYSYNNQEFYLAFIPSGELIIIDKLSLINIGDRDDLGIDLKWDKEHGIYTVSDKNKIKLLKYLQRHETKYNW